jgi:PAS domain S-box-containing protein
MPGPRIQVLLVDRHASACGRLDEMLQAVPGTAYDLSWVARLEAARAQLATKPFDLVMLNLASQGAAGQQALTELHQAFRHLPIVVLTEPHDEASGLAAVREGAQDYLIEGEFDGRWLSRLIRDAIARKRAETALQHSEEFFRLISENMTDLVAVIDREGRRLYSSPSYRHTLDRNGALAGTDSFAEVHPDDQERIRRIFAETLVTGVGQRTEYRMRRGDGSVRYIESQGSVIRDESGQPCKVVVVSRDITERKEAMEKLERTVSELRQAHAALESAQRQLVQAEKLEAVSTFAAGIAHEVKNPLQSILLGVDFLNAELGHSSPNTTLVLTEMENAARQADAVIRGLLEFSSSSKPDLGAHDLNAIVVQARRAVEAELAGQSIRVVESLASALPPLQLDAKRVKHVFIRLLLGVVRSLRLGGTVWIKTYARPSPGDRAGGGTGTVVAEVEHDGPATAEAVSVDGGRGQSGSAAARRNDWELMVIRKMVELFGGTVQTGDRIGGGVRVTLTFKTHSGGAPEQESRSADSE